MSITKEIREGLIDIGKSASASDFRKEVDNVSNRQDALEALLEGAKQNEYQAVFDGNAEPTTHAKIKYVTDALLKLSTPDPTELQTLFKKVADLEERLGKAEEKLAQKDTPRGPRREP